MKVQSFTIRASGSLHTEADQQALNDFMRGVEVKHVSASFTNVTNPTWHILLSYDEIKTEEVKTPEQKEVVAKPRKLPSYVINYNESDRKLWDAFFLWRKNKAEEKGILAKDVLADHVLNKLVKLRPLDMSTLDVVENFTKANAAEYGDEIVAICKAHQKT